MKIYNVWICVEEIDENGNNGEDIETIKIAKFKDREKAVAFAYREGHFINTPRDKEQFTI